MSLFKDLEKHSTDIKVKEYEKIPNIKDITQPKNSPDLWDLCSTQYHESNLKHLLNTESTLVI